MSTQIIILLIFCSQYVIAQVPIAAIESEEFNILYLGYPNRVLPEVKNNDSSKVILGASGVEIEKESDSEFYVVKPYKGREAALYVILDRNGTLDTISKKNIE